MEDLNDLTSDERDRLLYAFCRRATNDDWSTLLKQLGIDPFDPKLVGINEARKRLEEKNVGNASYWNEPPRDDRMDLFEFDDVFSKQWEEFLGTYTGRNIGNVNAFRGGVEKTVNATAAVVRECHFQKFMDGQSKTLNQVIEGKFGKGWRFSGKYGDQICIARGTGFLIGTNLLLTAKHNLYQESSAIPDTELVYVFDYSLKENLPTPHTKDIFAYTGKKIGEGEGPNDDWALVQLTAAHPRMNERQDRPRQPLLMHDKNKHPGHQLGCYSAGFSMGVPMKLSLIGHCTSKILKDRFSVNLDLFHGNSGSPVMHLWNNQVIGLFVAGFPDLVEKGDMEIGLRDYTYAAICKNRGGEHCQLIGSILPEILKILRKHNLVNNLPENLQKENNG